MTTKKIEIRAIDLISGLGNDTTGVPFRWLESLVDGLKKRVPDNEEGSCMVHGAAGLVFSYDHVLTPLEVLEGQLAEAKQIAAEIRNMLPREGGLTADQTARLKQLIGG